MKIYKKIQFCLAIAVMSFMNIQAYAAAKSDDRIKTYTYSEDEVYLLVVHYGFQTSVEFAKGEEIETISMGDSYVWKITPLGRRLFIKPLEESVRTNMTIITNKNTYQFDVVSKTAESNIDKELSYVIRFYYPPKNTQNYFNSNTD